MNTKSIIFIIVALGVGLGIGYFLFAGRTDDADLLRKVSMSAPTGAGHTEPHGSAVEEHDHGAMSGGEEGTIWTCSMDPQVRQNEPGDCPICGMDLIRLEQNASNDPLVLQMTEEAVRLSNIQTTVVGAGADAEQAGKVLRLSGKVQEDERRAASLVAHVPGRIEKLSVTFEGEQVRQGQKIASVYSPDLISAQRELLEALKLQNVNPDLVKAARDKLRYWMINESTIQQIESSGTIQETFDLYANASGVVQTKKVEVGDYVRQGAVLFEVINLSKVWVIFDAYEEDLAHIGIGDRIEFTTPALPNRTFKTRVTFIDPTIDPQKRVAAVRTEVNNLQGLLKPEMLVYGVLQQKANNQSSANLMVPKSAVLWTGKRSVVYVKVPELDIPSYQFRVVELGASVGDSYIVSSGLEAGEEVVSRGSFAIDAAAQLNNQASMMTQEVQVKKVQEGPIILPDFTTLVPLDFQRQLLAVTEQYLALKDALVLTDPVSGGSSANKLLETLDDVDMRLVKDDAHVYWMEQADAIKAHAGRIAEASDVEVQRKQFDFLSRVMIKVVKAFGLPDKTLYVQHCPMANKDQGGDWLSDEKAIRNPYFGDVMLTCGMVKDTVDGGR